MKHLLFILFTFHFSLFTCEARDFVTHVTVTTYNPVASQCDDTPLITADGTKIDHKALKSGKQRIIAVSRDLLKDYPYGSIVEVDGYGRFVVADTMAKRWRKRIDICLPEGAKHFKKENIKLTLIKKGK